MKLEFEMVNMKKWEFPKTGVKFYFFFYKIFLL